MASSTTPSTPKILKTGKLFLGGAFVRSESGRSAPVCDARGRVLARVACASRKDLRDAVVAARGAQASWQRATPYLRGQILYRMAEMLDGREEEMVATLAATVAGGRRRARREHRAAVDALISAAGWADKFAQVLGCANPVAGPYYVFTIPEACGVIGVLAPDEEPLLGLVALTAPVLVAGNTVVALPSAAHPWAPSLFAEVCATSDLPPGVLNLLTAPQEELPEVLAAHRDVDGIHAAGLARPVRRLLEAGVSENLKRVTVRDLHGEDWYEARETHSPYWIEPFVEMKTIWHPARA